jgi:hypothetical protein
MFFLGSFPANLEAELEGGISSKLLPNDSSDHSEEAFDARAPAVRLVLILCCYWYYVFITIIIIANFIVFIIKEKVHTQTHTQTYELVHSNNMTQRNT